jgi:phospholipid transport system substrate-binding protein
MKKLLIIILLLNLNLSNSYSIEPDVFIQSTVNRAANTLGGNFTKDERIQQLKQIAKETVDITGDRLLLFGFS